VHTFRGHTNFISAFQLYRAHLASASSDGTVKLWRARPPEGQDEDESPAPILDLQCHSACHCVQYSEAYIAAGSEDSVARVWDSATGEEIHQRLQHVAPVKALAFDDSRLVCGLANGQAKHWDMKTGVAARTFVGGAAPVSSVAIDHRELYVCAGDGVRIFDLGTGACRATMPTPAQAMAITPRQVVTADADGLVRMWNSATGACEGFMMHVRGVPLTCVSCDGAKVVAGASDGVIRCWNMSTRALLHTMTDHKAAVNAVQMDGSKAVSAGADNAIKVWNLSTGVRMYTLLGGSLQRRANNPPHPTRPGISGIAYDDSRIVASINSLLRIYDFESLPASAPQ
jgi:WD40 repeat protein